MPNWCNNTLELQHEDPAMIQRAVTAMKAGTFLHEFIPVPKELSEATANFSTNEALVAKYGYSDWYSFCVNEWGTKWDVGGDDYGSPTVTEDGKMIAGFDSAWSPPITAMERLVDLGFTVKLYYYEPGMCFAGIWENGDDDFFEYGGMSSDQVDAELPADLNEMFCIAETVAEYEDEENQDIDLDGGLSATNE